MQEEYIYLRARYYDPSTGSFISEDPIRDGGNWYSYCEGNPIRYIDPTGEKVYVVGIGATASCYYSINGNIYIVFDDYGNAGIYVANGNGPGEIGINVGVDKGEYEYDNIYELTSNTVQISESISVAKVLSIGTSQSVNSDGVVGKTNSVRAGISVLPINADTQIFSQSVIFDLGKIDKYVAEVLKGVLGF